MSERTRFEIFVLICMLGFIFPGFGRFVSIGCFMLLIFWASCAIMYKANQETFDKLEKEGFMGKLIPNMKPFMCGHDTVKELIPAWLALVVIGVLLYFPTVYLILSAASGGGST